MALGAVGVGLALFVPNRANGWCVQSRLGGGQRIEPVASPSRACVRTVRELELRGFVAFLDTSGARSFYSGFGMGHVDPFAAAPGERFAHFTRRTNVGVVVLEPLVLATPLMRDDPDAKALAEGRESELFRVFPVEGHPDYRIAVRRDLLPPVVYQRPKTGFALPMRAWMKGPLAPFVDQGLREIVSRQLLPQPFVAQLREQFERERLHWTRLWSVVVLAHFVRCNQPVPHPDENLALHPLA